MKNLIRIILAMLTVICVYLLCTNQYGLTRVQTTQYMLEFDDANHTQVLARTFINEENDMCLSFNIDGVQHTCLNNKLALMLSTFEGYQVTKVYTHTAYKLIQAEQSNNDACTASILTTIICSLVASACLFLLGATFMKVPEQA